jgi:membrane protein YdbS with pleckstrin-like domain
LHTGLPEPLEGEEPQLLAVEPGYKNVLRVRTAIVWLGLTGAAAIAGEAVLDSPALSAIVFGIGLAAVAIGPQRRYNRLRYGLSERILQVMRGWLFHTDTMVPLVRVQHIDVVRGPLDKLFGTASLVLHTAGTHNSIVTVPGLAPNRATAMRDIIREHVRTDFA